MNSCAPVIVSAQTSQMFLSISKHSAGFRAQTLAAAIGARCVAAILRQEDAHMQLVLLAFQLREESTDARPRAGAFFNEALLLLGEVVPRHVRSECLRSCAARFISPWCARYFGFVHGSIAPSSSVLERSGMMRPGSKSIVLPNPWQRGHAPYGLLKLKSRGSGSR